MNWRNFGENGADYPNIAAFRLNEDTENYIMDVCAGLLMPWMFMPAEADLTEYEAIFSKHYPPEFLHLYAQAKSAMRETMVPFVKKTICVDVKDMMRLRIFGNFKNARIFIYGTRELGREKLHYLRELGLSAEGFVVSDRRKKVDSIDGIPVFELSRIADLEDVLIILANEHEETVDNLRRAGCDWIKLEKRLAKKFGDTRVLQDSNYTRTEEIVSSHPLERL